MFVAIAATATISCTKQPTACIKADKTEYTAGETIKLTNCSEDADHYTWTLPATSSQPTSNAANIDYTLDESTSDGSMTFKLTALSKKDKKKDETSVTVSVKAATGKVTFWQSGNLSYDITSVTVNSTTAQITQDSPNGISGCDVSGSANFTLKVGTYSFTAAEQTPRTATWSGNVTVTKNGRLKMQLN